MTYSTSLCTSGLAAMIALLIGCGQRESNSPSVGAAPAGKGGLVANADVASTSKVHSHDGWWCDEHGVPEEVCGQCNPKLAAEFQKKGDWCKEHDRPDSQCFVCHPELEAKFAARYEAKFGAPPPKPE